MRKPNRTTVEHITELSKNVRSITLTGDSLAELDTSVEGGYFKLMLPSDTDMPYVRTYTVRKVNEGQSSIDVEFAIHDGSAPASNWAESAKVGSEALISPPVRGQMLAQDADWHIIAADMTGMPAALVNLEALPSSAKGYVVFEVSSESDIREIAHDTQLELVWVVNPEPGASSAPLAAKIRSLPWLDGEVSTWSACEFSTMRELRAYFRKERQLDKKKVYISSYWKKGLSEDQHKRAKRADAEEFGE
jgi:NADPH-dependent ferric siderophore reductase